MFFPEHFQRVSQLKLLKLKYIGRFNNFEKEHMTQYFYRNNKNFKIKKFTFKKAKKIIKLSIDTKNDLNNIIKKFSKNRFENFQLKR